VAAKRGDVSERAKGLAQKGGSGRRLRTFNMSTYKIHALGDYPRAIRMFGTTDGFTTQVVSNRPQMIMMADHVFSGRVRTSQSQAVLPEGPQGQIYSWYCKPTMARASGNETERTCSPSI
jgi:hypothetical protein